MSKSIFIESKIGKDVMGVLNNPDSVSFFYVSPKRSFPHYAVITPEILLSNELKLELHKLLMNDDHYVKEISKLTIFLPTIGFQFHKENMGDLIVLLSPAGDQLKIIEKDQKDGSTLILDYDPAKIGFDSFMQKLENKYPHNL
ncbi:MAG: hypothetical protein H0W50_02905 [Parachlamydiaceae bacterium]|nr:hypothetical protein [Parachlamydiaceae bacterium]